MWGFLGGIYIFQKPNETGASFTSRPAPWGGVLSFKPPAASLGCFVVVLFLCFVLFVKKEYGNFYKDRTRRTENP